MSHSTMLARRAAHFQKLVMDMAYGPGGMIIHDAWFDTRRPYQYGEDHGIMDEYIRKWVLDDWGDLAAKPDIADYWYGEDTIGLEGMFLWSQLLRWRATQEEEAKQLARKCFLDLNNIFRLTATLEPGVIGKPYGGRPSLNWSFDQAAIPIIPYAQYAVALASPEEKAIAVENLSAHGEMYLRRNWVIIFCGRSTSIIGSGHPSGMKLLGSVYACHEVTGQTKFRDAVLEKLHEMVEMGTLPWPQESYPVNHNMFYWGWLCDYWNKSEFSTLHDWKRCISEYWQATKSARVGQDGMLLAGSYNNKTRTFTPDPHGWIDISNARALTLDVPRGMDQWWTSPTSNAGRPAGTIWNACMALLAHEYGLDRDASSHLAKQLLLAIDEDRLRWWWDDGQVPETLKPFTRFFSTSTTATWLVAYWMGRLQGVW